MRHVFSATAVTATAYDPGDIILYDDESDQWKVGEQRVDQTVGDVHCTQIHMPFL